MINEPTFDLLWMQRLTGATEVLRRNIPASEAMQALILEERFDHGMGSTVFLRPTEPPRPTIVCLCGSTRFWRTFQQASLEETMVGKIVLSIGAASGTDDEHFGNLPRDEYDRVKAMLDELHLRKIDLADEVLILNVQGYIGPSTARELAYARSLGKRVRFLEPTGEG